jgi:hypothetical protein
MKKVKISLSFKRLSAVLLAVFGQSILTAMTNNAYFPNPYPVLSLLQTAVTNLVNAIANQHPGDKTSTEAVTAAKEELNRVLTALAGYVAFESDTDKLKALSSGFSLTKTKGGVAVSAFTAVQGLQSGSVDVGSPVGGKSYIWGYTLDPIVAANWLVAATTAQPDFTINGLTPGVKYWFNVALVTPAGQQPACNPIMVHVV